MLAWGHLAQAREAPRIRLAVNQCIPTGALLAGSFGRQRNDLKYLKYGLGMCLVQQVLFLENMISNTIK